MSRHVLSLLVEDKPGLLTRVAGLFARRGFNIDSLAVGVTEVPGLSRITVVVDVEGLPLEQVTKQLNKLVNVIKIVELEPAASVQREHMLIKVRADNQTRSNVIEVVNLFRASVVDYATDALVVEVTGDRGKIDAILRALERRTAPLDGSTIQVLFDGLRVVGEQMRGLETKGTAPDAPKSLLERLDAVLDHRLAQLGDLLRRGLPARRRRAPASLRAHRQRPRAPHP